MHAARRLILGWVYGFAGVVTLVVAAFQGYWFLGCAGAVVGLSCFALFASPLPKLEEVAELRTSMSRNAAQHASPSPERVTPEFAEDDLVGQMLAQQRFALLLRPQITDNLNEPDFLRALEVLDDAMALVPGSEVLTFPWTLGQEQAEGRLLTVEPFFLDRYPVTNRSYAMFVEAGGYEQMSLWDSAVLAAVLDFVDQTGHHGPRHWRDGRYPKGEQDHPVAGISWFEALAYSRWVGKRLPTGAEWVKAGCWPVPVEGQPPLQRRYPWGDAMDRQKANLFGSGHGRTCSVYEYQEGMSVGGVYHLVGNVWEWTAGTFQPKTVSGLKLETKTPMKMIRGGAFDTYFDNQAACQFQSGENPMVRRANIGFRCALSVCDVAGVRDKNEVSELLHAT